MLIRYLVRFTNGITRELKAKHDSHAQRKARGIAESNKWTVQSVGRI